MTHATERENLKILKQPQTENGRKFCNPTGRHWTPHLTHRGERGGGIAKAPDHRSLLQRGKEEGGVSKKGAHKRVGQRHCEACITPLGSMRVHRERGIARGGQKENARGHSKLRCQFSNIDQEGGGGSLKLRLRGKRMGGGV